MKSPLLCCCTQRRAGFQSRANGVFQSHAGWHRRQYHRGRIMQPSSQAPQQSRVSRSFLERQGHLSLEITRSQSYPAGCAVLRKLGTSHPGHLWCNA